MACTYDCFHCSSDTQLRRLERQGDQPNHPRIERPAEIDVLEPPRSIDLDLERTEHSYKDPRPSQSRRRRWPCASTRGRERAPLRGSSPPASSGSSAPARRSGCLGSPPRLPRCPRRSPFAAGRVHGLCPCLCFVPGGRARPQVQVQALAPAV